MTRIPSSKMTAISKSSPPASGPRTVQSDARPLPLALRVGEGATDIITRRSTLHRFPSRVSGKANSVGLRKPPNRPQRFL